MKEIKLLLILLFITSCSSQQGYRKIANIEEYKIPEIYQVGEVKVSLLEPTDFKEKYGDVWYLMDGRSSAGTDFAALTGLNSIPDARGKFLRMVNAGASGENYDPENRAVGSYQKDLLRSHSHNYRYTRFGHDMNDRGLPTKSMDNDGKWHSENTKASGGAETRPKNIGVYYYVKINSCSSEEDVCL